MSAERALVSWLKDDAATDALIDGRVYPQSAAQGKARPYVVVSRLSGNKSQGLSGPAGMAHATMQLRCVADSDLAAIALAKTIHGTSSDAGLDGHRGTVATIVLAEVTLTSDSSAEYEPPQNAGELGAYVVTLEFLVSWLE